MSWQDDVESPDPRFEIHECGDGNGSSFLVGLADDEYGQVEMPNGEELTSFQWREDAEEFVEEMAALLDEWGGTSPRQYRVAISYEGIAHYTVKAQTEEQARELALGKFNDRAFRNTKSTVDSVEEIAEASA
jgi:hypothetical protein